jgi:hypothetical protein
LLDNPFQTDPDPPESKYKQGILFKWGD